MLHLVLFSSPACKIKVLLREDGDLLSPILTQQLLAASTLTCKHHGLINGGQHISYLQ